MELESVRIEFPEGANIILGQSHFLKTIEDLYEIVVSSAPSVKFGIAFCEASGPRLVRVEGNDHELESIAADNAMKLGAGHSFLIVIKDAFPINMLNAIKQCPEVCGIFCATANPVEAVVARTEQGRGVLGVIDGQPPLGIEQADDVTQRRGFLRTIGYKR
ncbi:MAG: adenosine-specific kinase [Deltaproteobacteria bacterium]|nr:adenosine-specific kinase [Deltaproteobacteria bacterium]